MEINQRSFKGGLNLLVDDTRPTADLEGDTSKSSYGININQYRIGFNVRSRYDVLDPINSSVEDGTAPQGLKQGILAFGNYVFCFIAGLAYYRPITSVGWTLVQGFGMSTTAPRYWFLVVPVIETNYGRVSQPVGATQNAANTTGNSSAPINRVNVSGAFGGSEPGILVQDGSNQPQFIFLDTNGFPECRTTQTYAQWTFTWDSTITSATYGTVSVDEREYVPIGTCMEIYNGITFILAPDGTTIYRSVSGRPLDFVVNVDINGQKGGDATTTSYSVGVGGITVLKNLSGGLFVSSLGNACFNVVINTTPNAPTIFGEYTFIRTFLFTAACVSDRALIDINGDTAFVDVNGLRTFNSILQNQNEGRNSVFSKTISSLLTNISQDPLRVAAGVFDNYALFSVKTIYGYVLIVWDTINNVYSSIDISQFASTSGITQFAVIQTEVTALFGITFDNKVIQLYASSSFDTAYVRFMSVCSQNPKTQIKHNEFRAVLSQFTQDSTASLTTFIDNRIFAGSPMPKNIKYVPPQPAYTGVPSFSDANTQVQNLFWTTPNADEGWKAFNVLSWTGGGRITNVNTFVTDSTPMNPLKSQANVT